jgi:hypothetical protein
MTIRSFKTAAAVILLAAAAVPAEAQQRRSGTGQLSVTVVNRAAQAAQYLYVVPSDALPWGDDRLGRDTISAGGRHSLKVDRTRNCRYDVRAVFAGGATDVLTDVNLCAAQTITLTGDNGLSPVRLARLAAREPVGLYMVYNRTDIEMMELKAGKTSHLDGMTVDAGASTVGRFRRSDGCKVDLVAEFKDSDPSILQGKDLCETPIVSFVPPARRVAIRFTNRSNSAVVNIHIRPVGFESWGPDRLGSDTLAARDIKRISIAPTDSCLYDVKVSFGQNEENVRSGVNLCARRQFDIEGPDLVTGKGDRKAAPAADPDPGDQLPLKVANESGKAIREIFVSPAKARNWGGNLVLRPIEPGASADIRLEQEGTCLFDLKAVFAGGREQRMMNRDLCRTTSLSIGGPHAIVIDGGGPEEGLPARFVNTGRVAVQSLHVTPSTDTHWGDDRLGSNQLERRARLDMRLPRAGGCLWDVKIAFVEGAPEERRRVDFCAAPEQQVRQRGKPGSVVSTGTGFFITTDGHVLTNSHVVDACAVVAIARDGEPRIPLRLIRDDAEADLALMKADVASASVVPLRSSAASPARTGERAIVVGYPVRDKLGVINITEGIVSFADEGRADRTRIQFTAPAQPGNSGGPVLDGAGQAIGVVVSRLGMIDDERASQNVNFGVGMPAVEAFLREAGLSPPAEAAVAVERPTPDVFAATRAAVLPLDCLE